MSVAVPDDVGHDCIRTCNIWRSIKSIAGEQGDKWRIRIRVMSTPRLNWVTPLTRHGE